MTAWQDESGITLVETLVAGILLVIGMLGLLQLVDVSTRTTFRAEQSQVANNVAQRELEELRNLDYGQVAMTSPPSAPVGGNDPRTRVTPTPCASATCEFDLNRDGNLADLVIDGGPLEEGGQVDGGLIAVGPEEFESGDVNGEIFRFVVWRNDPRCAPTDCPGLQDLKRAVVAVRVDKPAVTHERPYVEVHTDFLDPSGLFPDPEGDPSEGQQFWLSDTPCDNAQRQPIVLDPPESDGHPSHNTLGSCPDGVQTGTAPGAPDLLIQAQPPDPTPDDPGDPLLYDYSADIEPTDPELEPDPGLQLLRPDDAGCDLDGAGDDAHQEVHRWVSAPLPTQFEMKGEATLELFTRSLGGAQHGGEVCVFLFRRAGETSDNPIALTGASAESRPDEFWQCGVESPAIGCATTTWPTDLDDIDRFRLLRIELDFGQTAIAAGDRLGIAIAPERDGTGGADVIPFAYDHPDYRSRLEVDTSTPLGE